MIVTKKSLKNGRFITVEHVKSNLSIEKLIAYLKELNENSEVKTDVLLNYTEMLKVLIDRKDNNIDVSAEMVFNDLNNRVQNDEEVDLERFSFLNPDMLFIYQKSKNKRYCYLNGELIKVNADYVFPVVTERIFKFY